MPEWEHIEASTLSSVELEVAEKRLRGAKVVFKKEGDLEMILVLYGPVPWPDSPSTKHEPLMYQILWFGSGGQKFPDTDSEYVFLKAEKGKVRHMLWLVPSKDDVEGILVESLGLDIQLDETAS